MERLIFRDKNFLIFTVLLILIIVRSLPLVEIIMIGGYAVFNYFYVLSLLSILFVSLLNKHRLTKRIVLLFIIIAFCMINGFYHNNHKYFNYGFLVQDILAYFGLIMGFYISVNSNRVIVFKFFKLVLFSSVFFLLLAVALPNIFGISSSLSADRNLFFSTLNVCYFILFSIPIVFVASEKNYVQLPNFFIVATLIILVIFSFYSAATRHLIILELILFLGWFKKYLIIYLVLGLFLTGLFWNTIVDTLANSVKDQFLMSRFVESDYENEPRLLEAFVVLEQIKDNKLIGLGLGVGNLRVGYKDKEVIAPHITLLASYIKGGLLLCLYFIFMFFIVLKRFLLSKSKSIIHAFTLSCLLVFGAFIFNFCHDFLMYFFLGFLIQSTDEI